MHEGCLTWKAVAWRCAKRCVRVRRNMCRGCGWDDMGRWEAFAWQSCVCCGADAATDYCWHVLHAHAVPVKASKGVFILGAASARVGV